MEENFNLWNEIQSMDGKQLKKYYVKQEYLKKYVNC